MSTSVEYPRLAYLFQLLCCCPTVCHDLYFYIEGDSCCTPLVSSCAPPAFAIGQEVGVKIVEKVADKVIEKGGKSLGEKIAA